MRLDEVPAATVRGQYRTYRMSPACGPALRHRRSPRCASRWTTGAGKACRSTFRSGKLLASKATEITVQFKMCRTSSFPSRRAAAPGQLHHVLHPAGEGLHLRFETKIPGAGCGCGRWKWISIRQEFGAAALPDAYERLLLDALTGDASLFARADEIELSWQIIDPIQAGWDASDAALPTAQGWRTETARRWSSTRRAPGARPAPTAC